MLITNFKSISNKNIVMVGNQMKNYLERLAYCPISYDETTQEWAFQKTKDILDAINSNEGGRYG
jgi:predicted RNA-binding protein with EMAP domain